MTVEQRGTEVLRTPVMPVRVLDGAQQSEWNAWREKAGRHFDGDKEGKREDKRHSKEGTRNEPPSTAVRETREKQLEQGKMAKRQETQVGN